MLKLLVPVDGSRNSHYAVRYAIKAFTENTAMEVHLLNVQPMFSQYIARFVSKRDRDAFHRDEAEKVLRPIGRMLDHAGVPHTMHIEVGNKARLIVEAARRLRCDRIVMSTARKNSLIRMVEDSVIIKVLELTTVPVEVIAGDAASKAERYGIPAGVGAFLASLFFAAAN